MTFDEWLLHAAVYWQQHTAQREGQAHFNSLCQHRPQIAETIHTTSADPFFNDERLPLFLETVGALWN